MIRRLEVPLRNEYYPVLFFWWGDLHGPADFPAEKSRMWFQGDPSTDEAIARQFKTLHDFARTGRLHHWTETPEGRLALILILDQFSRHLYRGKPESFAQDAQALDICLTGLRAKIDQKLYPIQRYFFYMPLEHSENIECQRQSVQLFGRLRQEAPVSLADPFTLAYDYAVRHFEIIERFGRFPHRNQILGRPSTPQEVEFLKEPGSSF